MRVRIVRDGKTTEAEVARDLQSVTVDGRTYPVVVVRSDPLRVELEVGGERVQVENWPDHFPEPPGPVDINGERSTVTVERLGSSTASTSTPPRPSTVTPVGSPPAATPTPEGGTGILPPMPGKILEVRVAEGQRVEAGAVVLVLEAMKMRNEVTTPVAGIVRGLRVRPGTNVRAREAMLFVVPA